MEISNKNESDSDSVVESDMDSGDERGEIEEIQAQPFASDDEAENEEVARIVKFHLVFSWMMMKLLME